MDTVARLIVGVESAKLGKLRPNQKLRRIYNGWINFSGVGHCKRAMREIEQSKNRGMKLLKIGRPKDYRCGAITKNQRANFLQKTCSYMLGEEASAVLQKVC